MKKYTIITSLFAVSLLTTPVAMAGDFGLGLSVGTSGVSAEVKTNMSDKLVLRGAYNYFDLDVDEVYDGIAYTGKFDMSTFGGFADFHPMGNGFLLSGGAYLGDKGLTLNSAPTGNVTIGDINYTPAQVGTLKSTVELASLAPYAGLGFDNFGMTDGAFSVNLRLGVMMTGTPEVDLQSAGGLLSGNPLLEAEIAREEANIADEIDKYKFFPVISIGTAYAF
ncbi:MAG: hypothetical protein V3U82_08165 [Robiginitomaculum sp.]